MTAGSTIEYHRAQIRRHLGFRDCTAENAGKLTGWLAAATWPGTGLTARARPARRPGPGGCSRLGQAAAPGGTATCPVTADRVAAPSWLSRLPGAVPVAAPRLGSTAVSMPVTRRALLRPGDRAGGPWWSMMVSMCTDETPAATATARRSCTTSSPRVVFDLEPVDAVTVTTLMDNVTDVFMPDQGPARRHARCAGARRPAATMEGGDAPEPLLAEHGFSVLVTVTKDGAAHQHPVRRRHQPRRRGGEHAPAGGRPVAIEVIVCSHGHFDHTTGLDGLIRRLGTVNLPVLIHPHFWRRRRVAIPGRDPLEIPATSRSALIGAGFEVVEERQPSFLFDRSVLVTGEVPRTTGYEPGFPPQQAWLGGALGAGPAGPRRPGADRRRQGQGARW